MTQRAVRPTPGQFAAAALGSPSAALVPAAAASAAPSRTAGPARRQDDADRCAPARRQVPPAKYILPSSKLDNCIQLSVDGTVTARSRGLGGVVDDFKVRSVSNSQQTVEFGMVCTDLWARLLRGRFFRLTIDLYLTN